MVSKLIVSLLKHDVVLQLPDGSKRIYRPSGTVATLKTTQRIEKVEEWIPSADHGIGAMETVEVAVTEYGEPEGLPPERDDTLYLVSSLLAERCARPVHGPLGISPGRSDLIAPDTGPTAIRFEGQVMAVVRFQRF